MLIYVDNAWLHINLYEIQLIVRNIKAQNTEIMLKRNKFSLSSSPPRAPEASD